MKNKLIDLNNHLFAQLERLSDESLIGDALTTEINRSKAVSAISKEIIAGAGLALEAAKFKNDFRHATVPEQLECKEKVITAAK